MPWSEADIAAAGYGPDGKRPAQLGAKIARNARPVTARKTGEDGSSPPRKHRQFEQALQTAIIAELRPRLIPLARILATNGELPGGKEQERRAYRRKLMGYTKGTPDLVCIRPFQRLLWLEIKVGRNKQTPEQEDFEKWAFACGHQYAVVRSVAEAAAELKLWGMM